MTAVRILYNLGFPIVMLALLPGFLFRMLKRGKYRHKFGQRFAIYSSRVRGKLSRGGWTWVHAVSVGEVLIALKLIRELRSRDPRLPVVFSTTTSTGYALASKETDDSLEAIYNPVDFLWTARRALRLIRPRRLIPGRGGGLAQPHGRGQGPGCHTGAGERAALETLGISLPNDPPAGRVDLQRTRPSLRSGTR